MKMVSYRPMVVRKRPLVFSGSLDRMLDELWKDMPASTPAGPRPVKRAHVPVNVLENAEDFRIEMAVPGMKKEDFVVNVEDGVLQIRTVERETAAENGVRFIRREFTIPTLQKRFQLPESVDPNAIEASYEQGVLRLVLGKREEAKPQPPMQIEIQ